MKVVVFDPGGHTGFVTAFYDCSRQAFEVLSYGYFFESDYVGELISDTDVVVCERITIRANTHGFNPVGVEVMGVVKDYCNRKGILLEWQYPGLMKPALLWKVVDPGEFSSEHPKDAVCHLAMWLMKKRIISIITGTKVSVKNARYSEVEQSRWVRD